MKSQFKTKASLPILLGLGLMVVLATHPLMASPSLRNPASWESTGVSAIKSLELERTEILKKRIFEMDIQFQNLYRMMPREKQQSNAGLFKASQKIRRDSTQTRDNFALEKMIADLGKIKEALSVIRQMD